MISCTCSHLKSDKLFNQILRVIQIFIIASLIMFLERHLLTNEVARAKVFMFITLNSVVRTSRRGGYIPNED